MRSKRLAQWVVASLSLALMIVFAPYAHASPAGAGLPNDNRGSSGASPTTTATGAQAASPDPTWLAAKNAFRVRSGVRPNQPKGAASHPYILSSQPQTVCCGGGPPAADMLDTTAPGNIGTGVWEPSNGSKPNFGLGTSDADDAGHLYGDQDFYGMCGPGAADVALWYWPAPFNALPSNTVTDHAVTTIWTKERWRAYMTQLAWQIQWPGWPNHGMQDQTNYPTQGTTLYGMQGALNWEASGENPNTWLNYFYVIVWNNQSDQATFHSRVVSDVYSNSVPVVAEVDANLLDNWRVQGASQPNRHYITILGYDDNNGTYTYTDTCGSSTGCNGTQFGSDGGTHTVSQQEIWNAINAIPPTPFPNDPKQGDGGYIW